MWTGSLPGPFVATYGRAYLLQGDRGRGEVQKVAIFRQAESKASKTRRHSAGSVAGTSKNGRPRLPTTWGEEAAAARRIGCRRPMKWPAADSPLTTGVEGGQRHVREQSRSNLSGARAEGRSEGRQ